MEPSTSSLSLLESDYVKYSKQSPTQFLNKFIEIHSFIEQEQKIHLISEMFDWNIQQLRIKVENEKNFEKRILFVKKAKYRLYNFIKIFFNNEKISLEKKHQSKFSKIMILKLDHPILFLPKIKSDQEITKLDLIEEHKAEEKGKTKEVKQKAQKEEGLNRLLKLIHLKDLAEILEKVSTVYFFKIGDGLVKVCESVKPLQLWRTILKENKGQRFSLAEVSRSVEYKEKVLSKALNNAGFH